ncbi:sterile alpha motif domain-containing protein 15 [Bombina bombina]|uniref:sterile alpha motif domain-containing protein 15 n=1 Tax=Bombina bombina TaxID=8345 RepID=UPI00235AE1A2|nr:sterile alpha motif domain-containing protein 15 [Bombina bombina]
METREVALGMHTVVMEPQALDCLRWSCRDVGLWIRRRGFPQYEECFTENCINGRKLIHINCSTLPQMGVTDFEHMKIISQLIRDLLDISEPQWSRSISLPHRDNMGLFLEQKSRTGAVCDSLTYNQFIKHQRL